MTNERTYCTNKELAIYCGLLVDALVDYFCLSPKRDDGLTTDEFEAIKKDLLEVRDKYYNKREDEKERDRRRKTLRGQFEAAMECFNPEVEEAENPYLSDLGDGAELVRSFDVDLRKVDHNAYSAAQMRVKRLAPECWPTMKLIIKNGKDRQKSICTLITAKRLADAKSMRSSSRRKSGKRKNITRLK